MAKRFAKPIVMLLAALVTVVVCSPAAQAATLAAATWVASSTSPGDASRYTWTLTTATTGTVSSVTFTVPAGTTGTSLSAANAFGIGPASSITLSSGTVTYNVATPVSIVANTPILLSIDGFTNTSTPGTYASSVATNIDTALATTGVVFNANTATATFTVQQALSVASNTSSAALSLNPSSTADQSATPVVLTIRANAGSGYTLQASSTAMTSGGGATVAAVSAGAGSPVATGSFGANKWGYAVTGYTNGSGAPSSGVLTMSGGLGTATNYAGYTSSAEVIATQTGPTNGDTFTMVNRMKVDYGQAAGRYTALVTYTVAPTY